MAFDNEVVATDLGYFFDSIWPRRIVMLVTIVRAIGVPDTQVGSVIDASDWFQPTCYCATPPSRGQCRRERRLSEGTGRG